MFLLGAAVRRPRRRARLLLRRARASCCSSRRLPGRAVVLLRPDRAVRDGRPRGHAGGGAAAARDRRPALRAGRHAQAEGRDRRHRRAQRVRHRTQSPQRAVVCATTGLHAPARRARARGRARARAVARRAPRRHGHDDRVVRRRPGRLPHPDGVLQRHVGGGRRNDNGGAPVVLVITLVSLVVYALSLPADPGRCRATASWPPTGPVRSSPVSRRRWRRRCTKITGEMGRIPTKDLRRRSRSTRSSSPRPSPPGFSISSLFSTHPPLEKRLDQLARISADLDRPSA